MFDIVNALIYTCTKVTSKSKCLGFFGRFYCLCLFMARFRFVMFDLLPGGAWLSAYFEITLSMMNYADWNGFFSDVVLHLKYKLRNVKQIFIK